MVITFVKIHNKYHYNLVIVLLLGVLYDFCADGIVGSIFEDVSRLVNPEYYLMIFLIFIWIFMITYSAILIPPAIIINENKATIKKFNKGAFLNTLKPLIWIIPFIIYIFLLNVILGNT